MGHTNENEKNPFTKNHVLDKDLVIRMLKYEDQYGKSEDGQIHYKTKLNFPTQSLMVIYSFHKQTLDHFGFDTSDESIKNYRSIFRTYYKSPVDYDKDVLSSVYYMRANKCVYYNSPIVKVGDKLTNCNLLTTNGTKTNLFDVLAQHKYNNAIIGAFSNS
jgi:hypothetical protein